MTEFDIHPIAILLRDTKSPYYMYEDWDDDTVFSVFIGYKDIFYLKNPITLSKKYRQTLISLGHPVTYWDEKIEQLQKKQEEYELAFLMQEVKEDPTDQQVEYFHNILKKFQHIVENLHPEQYSVDHVLVALFLQDPNEYIKDKRFQWRFNDLATYKDKKRSRTTTSENVEKLQNISDFDTAASFLRCFEFSRAEAEKCLSKVSFQ